MLSCNVFKRYFGLVLGLSLSCSAYAMEATKVDKAPTVKYLTKNTSDNVRMFKDFRQQRAFIHWSGDRLRVQNKYFAEESNKKVLRFDQTQRAMKGEYITEKGAAIKQTYLPLVDRATKVNVKTGTNFLGLRKLPVSEIGINLIAKGQGNSYITKTAPFRANTTILRVNTLQVQSAPKTTINKL